jgi:release factor glutamine methyltransferase
MSDATHEPRTEELLRDVGDVLRREMPAAQASREAAAIVAEAIERASASRGETAWTATKRLVEALTAERRSGRPLPYVLGSITIRGLRLKVDPRVVIPLDPPVGDLVEMATRLPRRARVVDVGCGCGVVALCTKRERPDLEVIGSDVSDDAISVAKENAAKLGIQVAFEIWDGTPPGDYDMVVANPPYARVDEFSDLGEEVTGFQPHVALFGGSDGLDVARRIIATAQPCTLIAVEHDPSQTAALERLLDGASTRRHPDIQSAITVGRTK